VISSTTARRDAGRLAFARRLRRAGALIRAARTADPPVLVKSGRCYLTDEPPRGQRPRP